MPVYEVGVGVMFSLAWLELWLYYYYGFLSQGSLQMSCIIIIFSHLEKYFASPQKRFYEVPQGKLTSTNDKVFELLYQHPVYIKILSF